MLKKGCLSVDGFNPLLCAPLFYYKTFIVVLQEYNQNVSKFYVDPSGHARWSTRQAHFDGLLESIAICYQKVTNIVSASAEEHLPI